MANEDTTTGALARRPPRVLVVHDAAYEVPEVYALLRTEFAVSTAVSVAEAAEVVRSSDVACVVAIVGGAIRARPVAEQLAALGERLLFVRTPEASPIDDLFLVTSAGRWLSARDFERQLVTRVHDVVRLGEQR